MKSNNQILWPQKQTDPLLLKAQVLLGSYAKATGTIFAIMDHNYLSIPEFFNDTITERNTCLFCAKCQYNMSISRNEDNIYIPCRNLHIEEMKKANASGKPMCYMCDLGFMFWTSPVFSGKQFVGSFIGSGYLYTDKEETAEKMSVLGKGMISRNQIMQRLSWFHHADDSRISALSELMQICAEYFSNNGDYHETLKRRSEQQKQLQAMVDRLKEKHPGAMPAYPMDREKAFLEAIHNGDFQKGVKLLGEILGFIFLSYPDQFKYIQYRILELAILLSRMENKSYGVSNFYSFASRHFIKSIESAQNQEELIDAIYLMTQHLADEAFSFQGIRHSSALKKADRFIQNNLSRKLSLEEISEISGLSAPYFSTIFKKEMGENLSSYLNRLRVEKARVMLVQTSFSLRKIAGSCGFEDQGWFSKIFRSYTGINQGKYRQEKKITRL